MSYARLDLTRDRGALVDLLRRGGLSAKHLDEKTKENVRDWSRTRPAGTRDGIAGSWK